MIKFRYVYSNGKEIKTFIYTIEEIEQGVQSIDEGVLGIKGFKLISRDRFTGLKDKNGVDMFEGDEIEANIISWTLATRGFIVWDNEHSCYGNENEAGITQLNRLDKFEIISNTHIDKLKD